jgi:hypothetical protein
MTCECDREQDVLDALSADRWPDRGDQGLGDHVSECGICRDLVDVATALKSDQDAAWRDARVPSAGGVWWRAQLRAREDAARAAGRPVAFIQGVAASVAVWLAIALVRAVPAEYVSEWRAWLSGFFPDTTPSMSGLSTLIAAAPLVVVVIVGVWLVLTPIAIYLAVEDE